MPNREGTKWSYKTIVASTLQSAVQHTWAAQIPWEIWRTQFWKKWPCGIKHANGREHAMNTQSMLPTCSSPSHFGGRKNKLRSACRQLGLPNLQRWEGLSKLWEPELSLLQFVFHRRTTWKKAPPVSVFSTVWSWRTLLSPRSRRIWRLTTTSLLLSSWRVRRSKLLSCSKSPC